MKIGDTFRIPQPGTSLDSHLWVVISDPNKNTDVLIVNFTSRRTDTDPACVLSAHEHPFVKHETCVNYAAAKVVSAKQIKMLLAEGLLSNHKTVNPDILQRILEGAATSERMKLDHADILIAQGLIDC